MILLDYILQHWMDILGTVLGLVYLVLEMRENIWMWIVGSVMPLVYIFVLYDAGLYADCGMEVYYFLAGLYGFGVWLLRGRRAATASAPAPLQISRTPRQLKTHLWLLLTVLWMALGTFLDRCTDSTVPYIDGFTTAASVIGLWMLSRKLIEQWWVWMVVDAVSVGLYIYKGVYGRAALYSIYTLMAIYGYIVWKKKLIAQKAQTSREYYKDTTIRS